MLLLSMQAAITLDLTADVRDSLEDCKYYAKKCLNKLSCKVA